MLEIKDLKARVEDGEEILKGINLTVRPGKYTPSWARTAPANRPSRP